MEEFNYAEIEGTIYVKTTAGTFNIETFRKAQKRFNTNDPNQPKFLRLAIEKERGVWELLTVGNEPTDSLEALNNLDWSTKIEL